MHYTNKYGLPQPFVEAVKRDYTYKPKRYGVTSLLKGTTQTILERRHQDDIEADVSEFVWAVFGTAVHKVFEDARETENQMKEVPIEHTFSNGYTVSGRVDLYDGETGTVVDYKTASVWKAISGDWEDYRKQLLAYCWILRQMGFKADKGEIIAILKDHSKAKAKFDKSYPQLPIVKVSFKFTDKDFTFIEEWLEKKLLEISVFEATPDWCLPCCPEEERWHKPDKWAVVKKGAKRATKLCASVEEAESYIEDNGITASIEFRKGSDGRCEEYCPVCGFCDYWRHNGTEIQSA